MLTRRLLQTVSWLALAGTILPPVLFLSGRISLDTTQHAMFVATIAWFSATPSWMGHKYEPDHDTQPVVP